MDICGWCGAEFDNKTYLHICDDCVVVAEECCNRAKERMEYLDETGRPDYCYILNARYIIAQEFVPLQKRVNIIKGHSQSGKLSMSVHKIYAACLTERGKSLEREIINKQPNAHSFVKLRTQKDGCECADDILREAIANAN